MEIRVDALTIRIKLLNIHQVLGFESSGCDIRNRQHLFFLQPPSHKLYADLSTVIDLRVIALMAELVDVTQRLEVRIHLVNALVNSQDWHDNARVVEDVHPRRVSIVIIFCRPSGGKRRARRYYCVDRASSGLKVKMRMLVLAQRAASMGKIGYTVKDALLFQNSMYSFWHSRLLIFTAMISEALNCSIGLSPYKAATC